jgi:simple sugar transport system permease protein
LAALVAGVAAGALWALPAAALRAYRGGHEVISTIMLNSLALLLTDALVAGPLKQRSGAMASTDLLSPTTRLGSFPLGPVPVNLGLLLGVVLVAGAAAFFRRTTTGYEWQATGANPTAASYAAVDVAHNRFWALTLSGGIAGVAGAIEVLAFEGRFYQGFSGGVGFDALGVALLAGSTAWAVIPAAFLFGALANGGAAMQLAAQVPKELTTILLGLVILIAAAVRYRKVSEHG